MTPQVLAVVGEGMAAGLGQERTGVSLSEVHLGRLMIELTPSRSQPVQEQTAIEVVSGAPAEFDEEAEISDGRVAGEPVAEAPVVLPERSLGNRMGAALCYPALEALGLLEAASRCFRLPKLRTLRRMSGIDPATRSRAETEPNPHCASGRPSPSRVSPVESS